MDVIFTLALPFFAVAGLGYLAGQRGILGDGAVRSLNVFVFYFAMPALLIRAVARQEIADVFVPVFFAGYLASSLLVFAVGAILARMLRGAALGEMAVSGQTASIPNIGFLGLPLVLAAYGESSAGPFTMALIVDLVFMIPLSILLLELAVNGSRPQSTHFQALRGVLVNPFLLSIGAGLALALAGTGLPGPVDALAEFLGGAAGPAALFALGASLSGRPVSGDKSIIAALTVTKLILHPLVVLLMLGFVLPVGPELLAVAVTLAALPTASNVFVIAVQYDTLAKRVSTTILLTTAFGVFTVSAVLLYFQG